MEYREIGGGLKCKEQMASEAVEIKGQPLNPENDLEAAAREENWESSFFSEFNCFNGLSSAHLG
jgi:hypothetical protein